MTHREDDREVAEQAEPFVALDYRRGYDHVLPGEGLLDFDFVRRNVPEIMFILL